MQNNKNFFRQVFCVFQIVLLLCFSNCAFSRFEHFSEDFLLKQKLGVLESLMTIQDSFSSAGAEGENDSAIQSVKPYSIDSPITSAPGAVSPVPVSFKQKISSASGQGRPDCEFVVHPEIDLARLVASFDEPCTFYLLPGIYSASTTISLKKGHIISSLAFAEALTSHSGEENETVPVPPAPLNSNPPNANRAKPEEKRIIPVLRLSPSGSVTIYKDQEGNILHEEPIVSPYRSARVPARFILTPVLRINTRSKKSTTHYRFRVDGWRPALPAHKLTQYPVLQVTDGFNDPVLFEFEEGSALHNLLVDLELMPVLESGCHQAFASHSPLIDLGDILFANGLPCDHPFNEEFSQPPLSIDNTVGKPRAVPGGNQNSSAGFSSGNKPEDEKTSSPGKSPSDDGKTPLPKKENPNPKKPGGDDSRGAAAIASAPAILEVDLIESLVQFFASDPNFNENLQTFLSILDRLSYGDREELVGELTRQLSLNIPLDAYYLKAIVEMAANHTGARFSQLKQPDNIRSVLKAAIKKGLSLDQILEIASYASKALTDVKWLHSDEMFTPLSHSELETLASITSGTMDDLPLPKPPTLDSGVAPSVADNSGRLAGLLTTFKRIACCVPPEEAETAEDDTGSLIQPEVSQVSTKDRSPEHQQRVAEEVAESVAEKIMRLGSSNQLAIRTVVIADPVIQGEHFRSLSELVYLKSPCPAPRPASLLFSGLPQGLLSHGSQLSLVLDTSRLEALYLYKFNAKTSAVMDPYDREEREHNKCLPPEPEFLTTKLEEINNRRISVYAERTSGHLLSDGSRKDGKAKDKYYGTTMLCNGASSEILYSHYKPEDILAIAISSNVKLTQGHDKYCPELVKILEHKEELEQQLGYKLPLVLYDVNSGSIKEVFFLEEIRGLSVGAQGLKSAFESLDQLCLIAGIQLDRLSKPLLSIGLREALTRIAGLQIKADDFLASKVNVLNRQLVTAVQNGEPIDSIKNLLDSGADSCFPFMFSASSLNLESFQAETRYKLVSLVHMLGIFKTMGYGTFLKSLKNSDVDPGLAENAVEVKSKYAEHCCQYDTLVRKLISDDADLSMFSINGDDITKNPFCCRTLLQHKATIDWGSCSSGWGSPGHVAARLTNVQIYAPSAVGELVPLFLEQYVRQYSYQSIDELANQLLSKLVSSQPRLPVIKHNTRLLLECLIKEGAILEESIIRSGLISYKQFSDEAKENEYDISYKNLFGSYDPEDYVTELMNLMTSEEARKKREYLKSVPKQMLSSKKKSQQAEKALCIIATLFGLEPLTLNLTETLDSLAERVLTHYYRRLYFKQVSFRLSPGFCDLFENDLIRPFYGVDHVLRTMRINQALAELFSKYDSDYKELFNAYPDLNRILPLAMLYHDVVAEVESKADKEKRASELFLQDMLGSDFHKKTVEALANALLNKNVNTMNSVPPGYTADSDIPENDRRLRRLLRLSDAIDITRVRIVPESFPRPEQAVGQPEDPFMFSHQLLDLDPELQKNAEFMEDFYDLMDNAQALASVTGGGPLKDLREKDYAARHGLRPVKKTNPVLKRYFKHCPNACAAMDERLDDNVRREIAMLAGVTVTSDHQLRQIPLPENLTLLDRFLIHRPGVRERLQTVANGLTSGSFRPPLGSLTPDLLSSEPVQRILEKEYGLEVRQVERIRGYDDEGKPIKVMLWTAQPSDTAL